MPSKEQLINWAKQYARTWGIPESIFINLLNTESGFNPNAQGSSGEIGIAQFMPDTAMGLATKWGKAFDPSDPQEAMEASAHYLKELASGFGGNIVMAVAAYNAGPGAVGNAIEQWGVSQWVRGIPVSTRNRYLPSVFGGDSDNWKNNPETMWQGIGWKVPEPWNSGNIATPPGDWSGPLGQGGDDGTIDPNNLEWPDPSFGVTQDYLNQVASIASAYAAAGMPLPAGGPAYAQAIYQATLTELQGGGQTPEQRAQAQADLSNTLMDIMGKKQAYDYNEQLNPLTLDEIRLKIKRGEALLPLEIQQLEQAIRLAEPVGAESVLRTESGAAGFRDYWSRQGVDESKRNDSDYMAGFNLAKHEGDPERRQALMDYINTIISTVSADISSKGLEMSQAAQEFSRHMDAWAEAGQQYEDMFKWSIPKGVEYVPGFEPGGIAAGLGMQPWKASPTRFDPFQMAQDILNKTPDVTKIGAPQVPDIDWTPYKEAQDQLAKFMGGA